MRHWAGTSSTSARRAGRWGVPLHLDGRGRSDRKGVDVPIVLLLLHYFSIEVVNAGSACERGCVKQSPPGKEPASLRAYPLPYPPTIGHRQLRLRPRHPSLPSGLRLPRCGYMHRIVALGRARLDRLPNPLTLPRLPTARSRHTGPDHMESPSHPSAQTGARPRTTTQRLEAAPRRYQEVLETFSDYLLRWTQAPNPPRNMS
jgi:hypothetical protein